MKTFLYICALLLAIGGIFSCRTAQPAPERDLSRAEGTPLTKPYTPVVVQPDSLSGGLVNIDEQADKPARRLFGLLPPKDSRSTTKVQEHYKSAGGAGAPKKCKGCTIINAAPGATVTTSTVGKKATAATAEGAVAIAPAKKAGPVVLADSGASVQVAASGKGPAAAAGRDATATTIKPPTPWLKYGLWAAAALVGYWLLFGGGGALLLALWRRNNSTSNQA